MTNGELVNIYLLLVFLLVLPFAGGLVSLAFKRRDADLVAGLFSLVAFVLAIIVSLKAGFRE
ncbi:MAG: hypothetical protein ACPL7E_01485, partial [bacterium]